MGCSYTLSTREAGIHLFSPTFYTPNDVELARLGIDISITPELLCCNVAIINALHCLHVLEILQSDAAINVQLLLVFHQNTFKSLSIIQTTNNIAVSNEIAYSKIITL